MKIEVERCIPGKKETYLSRYEVPNEVTGGMTIMDLLEYISLYIDPTLAYYSHSVCNHGVCGRCLLRAVNIPVLACTVKVGERESLRLGPADKSRIVRDLVIEKEGGQNGI